MGQAQKHLRQPFGRQNAGVVEAANDNDASTVSPKRLLRLALSTWFATFVFGGIALAIEIEIIAHVFKEPEFADLNHMGFVMAGVLGIGLAAGFVIDALRRAYR